VKEKLAKAQQLLDQEHPNPEEAIKLIEPLIAEGENHWMAWYFLGIAYMQKSDFEKAVSCMEKSIEGDADHPQTYLMAARCHFALGNFESAERFGKGAIQLDQKLIDSWMFMASLYQSKNLFEKAIPCLTIANKLAPDNDQVVFNMAGIYEEQGDLKKAQHLYEIVLRMNPGFEEARVRKDALYLAHSAPQKDEKPKFIHLGFNHLYAKSLSDMLGYINKNCEQQHILYVETHWAIENYQPDFNKDAHTTWFNHKNDLQSIVKACLAEDVDAVFIHGLFFSWQKELIQAIGGDKHIGWIIWGGDLYNPLKVQAPIYDIVEQIDSIHSLVEGDVQVFDKTYGARPTFRFGYPYPGLYGTVPVVGKKPERPTIIVGNSGDYSNNHIDILEVLRQKEDIRNYDIIVPASYNLIPEYERALNDWLKAAGMTVLVKLQKEFIEPHKYQEFISSSSMMITAHNRQQAIGNNLLSIYSGNPTILRKHIEVNGTKQVNPTWKMLTDYELNVFSFEKFKHTKSIASVHQNSPEKIRRQQEIIQNEFGMQIRAEDLVSSCKAIRKEEPKEVRV
jgi:tetratricopeptide (TPR) repeat protein